MKISSTLFLWKAKYYWYHVRLLQQKASFSMVLLLLFRNFETSHKRQTDGIGHKPCPKKPSQAIYCRCYFFCGIAGCDGNVERTDRFAVPFKRRQG